MENWGLTNTPILSPVSCQIQRPQSGTCCSWRLQEVSSWGKVMIILIFWVRAQASQWANLSLCHCRLENLCVGLCSLTWRIRSSTPRPRPFHQEISTPLECFLPTQETHTVTWQFNLSLNTPAVPVFGTENQFCRPLLPRFHGYALQDVCWVLEFSTQCCLLTPTLQQISNIQSYLHTQK